MKVEFTNGYRDNYMREKVLCVIDGTQAFNFSINISAIGLYELGKKVKRFYKIIRLIKRLKHELR